MLHAGGVRAMLTPEMRERALKLLAGARAMGEKPQRYDYQIGDYWNTCGEMAEFLEDLLDVRAAGAAHNPMFETGTET